MAKFVINVCIRVWTDIASGCGQTDIATFFGNKIGDLLLPFWFVVYAAYA